MKATCIIPARGGSKGIPRKNVLPLCGKPLLWWTVQAALRARSVGRVVVSTDDAEIAQVAESAGAQVVWRPAEIAGDAASSESALIYTLQELQNSSSHFSKMESPRSLDHDHDSVQEEILVFLQCTSPLTTAEDIDAVVARLIEENADSALSVADFHYFLWKHGREGAEAVNHDKRFRPRRQDREPQYVENGAIYAMRIPGFLEAKHRFFGKTVFHAMPRERCWEIDEPVDFEIAEVLLRKYLDASRCNMLPASIEAVIFDFDGVLTDDRVLTLQDGTEAVSCVRADGMGIRHLREAGIPVLILSSEENPVVRARASKLQVPVIHGSLKKGGLLASWAAEQGIDLAQAIYVGNDVNDIEPMRLVGCPIAVADAHPDAKRHAVIVLERRGGDGAAREVADLVLRSRGNFTAADMVRSSGNKTRLANRTGPA